jgi:F0F1-type ATP synthase assembly protein I
VVSFQDVTAIRVASLGIVFGRVTTSPDNRAPLVKAYHWASRGITVAVGMVLPGLLGYWLDTRLGTKAVFTILGFGLGMTYGIWQLLRMARPAKQ